MSQRGIKFIFTPGEFVLCFEPDPTKARVIYEAKILDTTVYRDIEGKKQPGYHIHFLRWNNSWDRVVNEHFVLKNTDENRTLMRQLADVARKVRKNKKRKKRIGEILTEAFNGKLPPFESDVEESDDEKTTDTNDTGDESTTESDSVQSEAKADARGDDQKKRPQQAVNIDIPEALRIVLDKDYFAINQEKKLTKVPGDINVVEVLESFVKTFMLDFWSPNFDRSQFCSTHPKISIERILCMCKEFVDGLKICFDFILPLTLLYAAEEGQYNKVTSVYKLKSPACNKQLAEDSPLLQSPRSRGATLKSLAAEGSSPRLPKLSPNILCDEEEDDNEVTFNICDGGKRKRVTRLSANKELLSKTETDDDKTEKTRPSRKSETMQERTKSDKRTNKSERLAKAVKMRRASDKGNSMLRRRPLRSQRMSSEDSNDSDHSKPDTVLSEPVKPATSGKSERSERPPPLLIPCNISNVKQNGEGKGADKGAGGSTDSLGDSGKEEMLDNILSWQMLSAEVQSRVPTPPSLLYGPHHLLRLFVKLPDLLIQMDIDDTKLGVLLKLLQQFLIYLSEHVVELFPDNSYMSASEALR